MRFSHALMLVVGVIAEEDESAMLQSQKVVAHKNGPSPDEGTSDSNCATSLYKSCQSPGNWTGSKCCFPDHYSCKAGDADSCTDIWTGWECCKNEQMTDDNLDNNCVKSLFLSCQQSAGKWMGSKCCFPDHYSCMPGDADSCTDTWTGWECCKDELATTTTTTLDGFVCNKSFNFIVGNYDQISLTGACPNCSAKPIYGESMGARYDLNLDGHAVTQALKHCKAECMKRSSCTAFFFQKHGNGHEICGFYSDAVNLPSTKMMRHGHQACSQVCIRDTLGDELIVGIWSQTGMPRSVPEAELSDDWQEVGDGKCHHRFGRRFQRKGVPTPTLMFANTGHIAGIQYGVNTQDFPLYPDSNLKAEGVLSTDLPPQSGDYALTTFFMDPDRICNSKREDHMAGKIGDRLWVANATGGIATASGNYEEIPLRQEDGPLAGYIPSGCAASGFAFPGSPGMGQHWWRVTEGEGNTACKDGGPVFLLYSRGRLVAMGLTLVSFDNRVPTVGNKRPVEVGGGRLGSPGDELWEWARQDLTPFFFHRPDNPKCLKNFNQFDDSLEGGTVTTATLHIWFSDPYNITCDGSV